MFKLFLTQKNLHVWRVIDRSRFEIATAT